MKKLCALIVDPEFDARMRLKQCTQTSFDYGQIDTSKSLREAMSRLRHDDKEACDVIFVSYKFSQEEIAQFIPIAKGTPNGRDSAFVLVLRATDDDPSTVVKSVLKGADGVLFEPYSVDFLEAITQLAAEVKLQRYEERARKAIDVMLYQAMDSLDQIADAKYFKTPPGEAIKQLRRAGEAIHELHPDMHEMYFQIAIEKFQQSFPAKRSEREDTNETNDQDKMTAEQRLEARMKSRGIS